MGNVQRRRVKVLMSGVGEDGKTTILNQLTGKIMTTPIGAFKRETVEVEYGGVDFDIWEFGDIHDKMHPFLRDYFADTEVLIFVVDSNDRDRMGECREELWRYLNEDELANVPLLVMANKQDLPNAMNAAEIIDKLGLYRMRDKRWYVQATVATSGDGLYEGLDWILTTLKIKKEYYFQLVLNDKPEAEKEKKNLEAEKEKENLEAEKEKKKKEDDQEAEFIRGVEEAIAKSGKINRKLAHFMFVGPPGSGKSSLMDRLLGRLRKEFSCSTGVCDSVVIVDIDVTKPSALHSITIVDAKDWKEVECQASFVGQMDQKNIIIPEQPEQDKTKSPLNGAQGLEKMHKIFQKFKKKFFATQSCSLLEAAAVAVIPKENITSVIKMYDSIDNFLKKSAQGKKTCSLYFRDTGGQVEFQEMLGLLIFGPSIFFFIFRLDLDFTSKFVIKYRKSASESINTYISSITTEEALLQCLTSVYAMDTSDESTIKAHKPLVYIIGTHKDNLGPSADYKIKKLNQYLDSLIVNNGFQGLVQYADEKKCQVMLTVDNTSPSDEDFASIRSKVTNLITIRNEFSIEYPVSYLVFCLELQNIKESILSLDECRRLAAKYGIEGDQVLHLLHFLHIRIGIIQHFNVEGLSHIVVKEPQVLFNKVTDLVIQTFSSSSEGFAGLTTEEARNLRKGILAASVFKSVINVDDKIGHEDFLRLLVHLRIITPFKTHEEDEEKRYFIPCVLNHVSESSEMADLETEISSLAVGFKSPKGTFHCPKGIFGILVTHIMTPDPDVSNECNTTFDLLQDKIFKDQVSFKVHSYGNRDEISIKITSSYLEIKFYPKSVANRDASVGEVCNDVREIIEKSVLKSLKDLHYNRARIEPTTCLKCEDCGELHPVVKGRQFHRIFCTKADEGRRLPPNGRYWYNEAVDDKPPSPPPADPVSTLGACLTLSDHFQVTQSLNDLNNEELQLLGGALGLHQPKLERMKTLPDDMVQAWLRADDNITDTSGSPSWESLAAALEACHHNGVASNIRKKHLQDQH